MHESNRAEVGGFDEPLEVRVFPNGRLELIEVSGVVVGRAVFEPGWKWSESVQPLVQTKSCEAPHFQYHVSGVLAFQMDDGTRFDCKAGDVSWLPSGHDSWVVGDEPVVLVDFHGMSEYAHELQHKARASAEERRHADERVRLILSSVTEGIVWVNNDGVITFANDAAPAMLGYKLADFVGQQFHAMLHHHYPDGRVYPSEECAMFLAAKEGRALRIDNEVFWRKDGTPIPVEYATTPALKDDVLVGAVIVFRDITARKEAERLVAERTAEVIAQRDEIERLANHDALTGLPTLRLARDRLTMACEQAKRSKGKAALLFIDLDGFKAVNDTFGHEAGDHVLKTVAGRLIACIRNIDTVARHGGDEFLVILGGILSADAATVVAGKIVTAISEPIPYEGHALTVGSSIGIAVLPEHGAGPEELLKKADRAMYSIKKSGKNSYALADGIE